jgi:ribosomal protein S18 acetylase RimI-like enzyme
MTTDKLNTTLIHLPDVPAIPGLTFRPFRGESDYPAMTAVLRGSKEADQLDEVETVADLANTYTHLVNCDPYQDVLCAQVDGKMIGYKRVFWRTESEGNWIYRHFGFLLPQWRRKGIGRAMLHHSERRLREIAAGHQANGPRFFQSEAADTQPGAEALLRNTGYAPVRHEYLMVRETLDDIPAMPLPEGLDVRPAKLEHYRAIWDAMIEAFRDHWGYVPPTEEEYQQWLHDPKFDPSLWRVAWDGDQVAGMVLGLINPAENAAHNLKRGWVDDVCVRRPWRRRGLARALLTQGLQIFKARGMTQAALGVDTENPTGALRVYESVGFRPAKRHSIYRKPLE